MNRPVCAHPDIVAVVVEPRPFEFETLACLCATCLEELPPNWDCPDCTFIPIARPCPTHAKRNPS